MAFSPLPPQAYTRDMLSAAFEWLHKQPPSIRELATDSDSLVSLYLRSRRRSPNGASEPSPSSESFKQDLKNLAEGLKQFDGPVPSPAPTPPTFSPTNLSADMPPASATTPVPTTVPAPALRPPPPQFQTAGVEHPTLALDQKSLEILRRTQQLLNLSHEREALRMLISLGYNQIKDLLPKN